MGCGSSSSKLKPKSNNDTYSSSYSEEDDFGETTAYKQPEGKVLLREPVKNAVTPGLPVQVVTFTKPPSPIRLEAIESVGSPHSVENSSSITLPANRSVLAEPLDDRDPWNLSRLTFPLYISHAKPGATLCASDHTLLFQDGSSTIEIRTPPKFLPKRISWRNGLVRDIIWSSDLELFFLLTKDSLFSMDIESFLDPRSRAINPENEVLINYYSKVMPASTRHPFWRCTCVHSTLYIAYSGYGTMIDQHEMRTSSSRLVRRWKPPTTCASHEGIWAIRYHSGTQQMGLAIMDARDRRWRFEVRGLPGLLPLWQVALPFTSGDCDISPLPDGKWLAINSLNVFFVQIAKEQITAAIDYQRILKNAIAIGNQYFVVRTKSTIEIHRIKSLRH